MDGITNDELPGIELYSSDLYYILIKKNNALICHRNSGQLIYTES